MAGRVPFKKNEMFVLGARESLRRPPMLQTYQNVIVDMARHQK